MKLVQAKKSTSRLKWVWVLAGDFWSRLTDATGAKASSEEAGHGHTGHFAGNRLELSGDWVVLPGMCLSFRCLAPKEARSVSWCALLVMEAMKPQHAASFK